MPAVSYVFKPSQLCPLFFTGLKPRCCVVNRSTHVVDVLYSEALRVIERMGTGSTNGVNWQIRRIWIGTIGSNA
jgi:hypothetical protein